MLAVRGWGRPQIAAQSSPKALPSAKLETSPSVDSHLPVGDAIGETGDEYNRPGIAPLGVSMTDAIVPLRVSRVIPSSLD